MLAARGLRFAEERSSAEVTVQPTRLAGPEVANRMPGARRDEQLVSGRGSVRPTLDLELDLAVHDHHDLFGGVDEVGPNLARRIDPQIARETSLAPAPFDGRLVHAHALLAIHQWPVYLKALSGSPEHGGWPVELVQVLVSEHRPECRRLVSAHGMV